MGPQSEIPVSEPVEHVGPTVDPINRQDSSRKAFLKDVGTGLLEGRELGLIEDEKIELLTLEGLPLGQNAPFSFAQGAFADIYKATMTSGNSKTLVAVKVFRGAHLRGNRDHYIKRVRKEYSVWEILKHRNILPLLGLVIHPKLPSAALVSAYKPLGDLRKCINGKIDFCPLSMVKGIACGVAYLHKENVVHGDLSLLNILVDEVGRGEDSKPVYLPLITDFGKSRVLCEDGYTTQVGTPRMELRPPELLKAENSSRNKETNKSMYTPASDVYTFSLLMLELLSGFVPYSKERAYNPEHVVANSIVEDHLRPAMQDYPLINDSDEFCWPIMEACWKGPPADRITSEEAYDRLLTEGPVAQEGPSYN